MIRFKTSAAADVPAPPAGYATLFVDAATGLPAAKGSDGIVVPLKGEPGAGLPSGGALGDVVTLTSEGPSWQAPAGPGTGPVGTWINMLPPDATLADGSDNPIAANFSGSLYSEGTLIARATRTALPNRLGKRLRVTATITVDVLKTDPGAPISPVAFAIGDDDQSYASFGEGSTVVEFEVESTAAKAGPDGVLLAGLIIKIDDNTNMDDAFAQVEITQFEVFAIEQAVEAVTTPLEQDPVALVGDVLSSGGIALHPDDNPLLAAASSVDVVGYYAPTYRFAGSFPPPIGTEIALSMYEFHPVAPLALTTGNPGPGTSYWWRAYNVAELPGGDLLLSVAIDGGAPVLAAASHLDGE